MEGTSLVILLLVVMESVKENRKVCKWYSVCPMKRFYQQGKLDRFWVENFCWVDNPECVRKKLEGKGIAHPDNMLPDGRIDDTLK